MTTSPATTQSQDVRQAPINPDHWYVVARSSALTTEPLAVTLWEQPIVLFRDGAGQVQALADRCPHRQVKLSSGVVVGDRLECAYHGWRFGADGRCVEIPYLGAEQKLPTCQVRVYPVQEAAGLIWLFPGDPAQAAAVAKFDLPEWDHLNYIATVSEIDCAAHFSFLLENLMDMYHGHLHDDLQAWAEPVLTELHTAAGTVEAVYAAQSYYRIDKIWSISQLFFPALRRLHPEPLTVKYLYPHWRSSLGQDFTICCLVCPVSPTHTRAFLLHFTSLHAFHRLHKLPVAFRRWLKWRLLGSAQSLLDGLVRQDVAMIEQEQQAYEQWAEPRRYEVNQTVTKVQQLIRQQAAIGQESQ